MEFLQALIPGIRLCFNAGMNIGTTLFKELIVMFAPMTERSSDYLFGLSVGDNLGF
jgi:hypothetical protein